MIRTKESSGCQSLLSVNTDLWQTKHMLESRLKRQRYITHGERFIRGRQVGREQRLHRLYLKPFTEKKKPVHDGETAG